MSRLETERDIQQVLGVVPRFLQDVPDQALASEWQTMKAVVLADDTAIPNKYKELIALAVAGATRCRYCAHFHSETARLFGATEEEIREAALVAKVSMGWSTWLNTLGYDFDEFRREVGQIARHVREQHAVPV